MLWLAIASFAIHVVRVVSWVILPNRLHRRLWDRDLCTWWMHDDDYGNEPWPEPITAKCRRCGRITRHPRAV